MQIIDEQGQPRTTKWLTSNFGPLSIQSPTNDSHRYTITELRATLGPAAITVKVLDAAGQPLPDIPTVWHWPDAPTLPDAGWRYNGVIGLTNEQGTIGHPMGGGAFYSPPTQGPHSLWIQGDTSSQLIQGLGMIAGTNHRHLDITFQDRTGSPPPPPPPPPPPDLAELRTILALIKEARKLLSDYIATLQT